MRPSDFEVVRILWIKDLTFLLSFFDPIRTTLAAPTYSLSFIERLSRLGHRLPELRTLADELFW